MTSNPVRVAVIGAGLMGMRHAQAIAASGRARLVRVADLDAARRAQFEAEFGVSAVADYRRLLDDGRIDAVSICLPDSLHREACLAALAADKHVLVEKPLATDLAEADQICAAACASRRVFQVGHLLRFDPRYERARDLIAGGHIGHVVSVFARRNSARTAPARYGRQVELPWHVTVHDVDLVRWVTGLEFQRISVEATRRGAPAPGQHAALFVLAQLSDGVPCAIESCWALPEGYGSGIDARLQVIGTEGALEVHGLDQGLRVAGPAGRNYPDTFRHFVGSTGRVSGFLRNQLEEFVGSIQRGTPSAVPCTDALAAVRVVDALVRAADAAATVTLPG